MKARMRSSLNVLFDCMPLVLDLPVSRQIVQTDFCVSKPKFKGTYVTYVVFQLAGGPPCGVWQLLDLRYLRKLENLLFLMRDENVVSLPTRTHAIKAGVCSEILPRAKADFVRLSIEEMCPHKGRRGR